MFSFLLTRPRLIVFVLTVLATGCGGAPVPDGLDIQTGVLRGSKQAFDFYTDACEITDCSAGPRLAVGDPGLRFLVTKQPGDVCLPAGDSLLVADPLVGRVQGIPEPVGTPCAAGNEARVQLQLLAAGSSQLQLVDASGAVVDELAFVAVTPAAIALHQLQKGPIEALKLRAGEQVELWTTLHDAAGGELAASGATRSWDVDGNAAHMTNITLAGHVGLWPWLAADSSGSATLKVGAGPLSRSIAIQITP